MRSISRWITSRASHGSGSARGAAGSGRWIEPRAADYSDLARLGLAAELAAQFGQHAVLVTDDPQHRFTRLADAACIPSGQHRFVAYSRSSSVSATMPSPRAASSSDTATVATVHDFAAQLCARHDGPPAGCARGLPSARNLASAARAWATRPSSMPVTAAHRAEAATAGTAGAAGCKCAVIRSIARRPARETVSGRWRRRSSSASASEDQGGDGTVSWSRHSTARQTLPERLLSR